MCSRPVCAVGLVVALVACGSRTPLEVGSAAPDGSEPHDAGIVREVGVDAAFDAPPDAGSDAGDATLDADDATSDAPDASVDAENDATPDVVILPDSGLRCDDGGAPSAYLLDESATLYRFDPGTVTVQSIGSFLCSDSSTPFTLSVSREGKAYVLFEDWRIFEVDLATLHCTSTPFQLGQLGLDAELAIAISRASGAEKLLVSGVSSTSNTPILAASDLSSFVLTKVGDIAPAPPDGTFPIDTQADLLGHLFGLSADGLMLEMEASTGAVLSTGQVPLNPDSSWAVMAYENRVFAFSDSTVLEYDPVTHSSVRLGDVGIEVVGASAVPCGGADGGP